MQAEYIYIYIFKRKTRRDNNNVQKNVTISNLG